MPTTNKVTNVSQDNISSIFLTKIFQDKTLFVTQTHKKLTHIGKIEEISEYGKLGYASSQKQEQVYLNAFQLRLKIKLENRVDLEHLEND